MDADTVASTVAKSVLPADEEPSLRRRLKRFWSASIAIIELMHQKGQFKLGMRRIKAKRRSRNEAIVASSA
jgi:hypothetical protein